MNISTFLARFLSYAPSLEILCAITALVVLIPPVRRWLESDLRRKRRFLAAMGVVVFLVGFVGLQAVIMGQALIADTIWCQFIADDCSSRSVTSADWLELWTRSLIPPPLRAACYSPNRNVCGFADVYAARAQANTLSDMIGLTWGDYLAGALSAGAAGATNAALAVYFLRERRQRDPAGEVLTDESDSHE